ncbi:hypothetical protein LJK87_48415 [Paenibacillus sp. P25]|nr:hypothetical protein LJK87_48415 [Paenibacillus sp. P25]
MGVSRKLLSRLKLTEQGITVNGERKYIDIKVKPGDLVAVRMEKEASEDILPQPMELDILYEDEEPLVLNKPAGLVVHPTHGHYTGTIANGVVHYWAQQGQSFRFRPVHRLDQETSGVLAIAKNPYVHQQISEQMQAHEVKKEYIALVHGWVETDAGTIEGPIDRDPQRPHIRIVTPEGYPAVTHYRVERRFREATMVRSAAGDRPDASDPSPHEASRPSAARGQAVRARDTGRRRLDRASGAARRSSRLYPSGGEALAGAGGAAASGYGGMHPASGAGVELRQKLKDCPLQA